MPDLCEHRFSPLVALVLLSAIGCGSAGPELSTVAGHVTLDGRPLPSARIEFQPDQGVPSYGRTDAHGHYQLFYSVDRPGVMRGKHTVRITTYYSYSDERGVEHHVPEKLPEKYHSQTELVREVEPGSNVINFELSSS